MRVAFLLNTPGFLRYFDVTIDALLERGHDVVLMFTRPDLRPESLEIYDGAARQPRVLGKAPDRDDVYAGVALGIRAAVDYVRYLDPLFRDAEFLRNRRRSRAFEYAPWTRVFGYRRSAPRWLVRALVRGLLALERAIPAARNVVGVLGDVKPDVLVVSPLITGASPQTDYVKAARAVGTPCAVCIASWDNLTNKGLVRVLPDRLVVWNDAQRREAVELHGVPDENVIVTGAQPFDRWFGRTPKMSRESFLRRVGLPVDRPYVLFVGSTSNIAREGVEEIFVRRWVEAIRSSDEERLAHVGILVRPHPDRRGSWDTMTTDGLDDAVVWPPAKPNSVTASARDDYFESLYHSAAVVGINTSAMIEAAIVGRPVLTIRNETVQEAQDGTIHFGYLLPENGGFVKTASDLPAHMEHLKACLADPDVGRSERMQFIDNFIRPCGRDVAANDVLTSTIEGLSAEAVEPARLRLLDRLLRGALLAVARYGLWRRARRDIDRADRRLSARSAALRDLAGRLEPRSRVAAGVVRRVAALHDAGTARWITHLKWRRRVSEASRKAARRAAKTRGQEVLSGGVSKTEATR